MATAAAAANHDPTVHTMLLLLELMALPAISASLSTISRGGFVGTYHAAAGVVADGRNTSAFSVGEWGIVASTNEPTDGGLSFRDGIKFHCETHDINSLFGMLIAFSEGGTFSNTNDTDLWSPLPTCRQAKGKQCDPHGPAGMLQGAARWSTLARLHCPQIRGVVIDDFWSNYIPGSVPPPGPNCPRCPRSHPVGYGGVGAGYYCCAWPLDSTHHCTRPKGVPPPPPPFRSGCCLWPGFDEGCQMDPKCAGNPTNATPCALSGGNTLGLAQMKDLQAALQGKTLREDGTVDHSSEATTPHLKIYAVTYEGDRRHFVRGARQHPLIKDQIVEGVSYWISGAVQETSSQNLTGMIEGLRAALPPVRDMPNSPACLRGRLLLPPPPRL
jgi:hypothetical protein